MTFGLHKCGTTNNHVFHLCGQGIPRVPAYKYLGFEHKRNAIDFQVSSLQRIAKATSLLTSLKLSGTLSLPSWLKIALYKTFIRPTAEYGLSVACSSETQAHHPVSDALQVLHTKATHWILPGNRKLLKVKQSLLGMGHSSIRVQELQGNITLHLRKMPPSNPLHLRQQSPHVRLGGLHHLLKKVMRSPAFLQWELACRVSPPQEKVTWRTYIRRSVISDAKPLRLSAYVLPISRAKKSLVDKALLIKDHTTRIMATTWRLNAINHLVCGICHKVLSRRHARQK